MVSILSFRFALVTSYKHDMILLYNPSDIFETIIAASVSDVFKCVAYGSGKINKEQIENVVGDSVDKIHVFKTLPHEESPNVIEINDPIAFSMKHTNNDVFISEFLSNELECLDVIISGFMIYGNQEDTIYQQFVKLFKSLGRISELDNIKMAGQVRLQVIKNMVLCRKFIEKNGVQYFRVAEYVHYNVKARNTEKSCVYVDSIGTEKMTCEYTLYYYNMTEQEVKDHVKVPCEVTKFSDSLLPELPSWKCTIHSDKLAELLREE